ncbi:predicted protein [Plenodomus lingam JN3]|uniref:Predicted protein n=1 Tax=Leptosphaeria maculans (strain JN3 / isolate v23.1.3 / race Av1-4-5-6-7-8) TaxID=985895 RepID=E4ZI89_LEPMJ|nr:predicted protein [Plenodomus lingam JN3]CBX90750.1 predicted protein [Plenodomus lingam JN3]
MATAHRHGTPVQRSTVSVSARSSAHALCSRRLCNPRMKPKSRETRLFFREGCTEALRC